MATRFTITDLVAQANTTLPDNTAQEISAADVRNMVLDFLATMKPAFGSMRRDTSLVIALNTATPTIIGPWSVISTQAPPEVIPNLIGNITKNITSLGNASATDRITFYIGVSGPAGNDLTFTLYANGSPLDVVARISTTGASNIVTVTLSGLVTRTVDTVYDIRAVTTNNNNYTFSNGTFRIENVPVA